MKRIARKLAKLSGISISAVALSLLIGLGTPSGARADEADARRLLKAMSDYMAGQQALSFGYDTTIEVITKEQQRLMLASSGTVTLNRPRQGPFDALQRVCGC